MRDACIARGALAFGARLLLRALLAGFGGELVRIDELVLLFGRDVIAP